MFGEMRFDLAHAKTKLSRFPSGALVKKETCVAASTLAPSLFKYKVCSLSECYTIAKRGAYPVVSVWHKKGADLLAAKICNLMNNEKRTRMESHLDMVIGFNNIDASLRDEHNARNFLKDTFSSGVSIENVFDSLGGTFNGLVFFLQAFEVWLERHSKESPVLGEEGPAQNTKEICHTAPNSRVTQGAVAHIAEAATS